MKNGASNYEVDKGAKKLHEHPPPMWLHKQSATHPVWGLILSWIFLFVISALVIVVGNFGLSSQTTRDFAVDDDIRSEQLDAVDLAAGSLDSDETYSERSQENDYATFWILYKQRNDGKLYTTDNVLRMKQIEDFIQNIDTYDLHCLAPDDDSNSTLTCAESSYNSFIRRFDFDNSAITQTSIDSAVQTLVDNRAIDPDAAIYLGIDAVQNANVDTSSARSLMRFGLPLADDGTGVKYKNKDDREQEQVSTWATDIGEKVVEYVELTAPSDTMDVQVFGPRIFDIRFNASVQKDFFLAFGSLLLVWVYMVRHTGSVFLSSLVITQVVVMFPFSFFFYNLVFGITFFHNIHILAIFVMLGISADDAFVYVDAWNQSIVLHPELKNDMATRVSYTWRRASKAMFVTTATTASAFLATANSTIMPIAGFGFWAAIIVTCNFLVLIIAFPPAVVLWETKFRGKYCCCVPKSFCSSCVSPNIEQPSELGWSEKFFSGVWVDCIECCKWPLVVFFSLLLICSISLAAQLPPLSEPEVWMPEDHPIQLTIDMLNNDFAVSAEDGKVMVTFTWGVLGVDRSGTSKWDKNDFGTVVWDDDFDMSPPENQQAMSEFCLALEDIEDIFQEAGQDGRAIKCFINGFQNYVESNNGTFPVEQSLFTSTFDEFLSSSFSFEYTQNNLIGLATGSNLRFVQFEVDTTVDAMEEYDSVYPKYERFQNVVDDFNSNAPAGVNKLLQTSLKWPVMITERAIMTSAIKGMGIAGALAFAALLFSTANVYIAIIATASIAGVVSCVFSVLFLSGAQFGIAESVAMVILIGLSVDYVVHLANAYTESHNPTRSARIRESLRDMAVSVIGGAVTTILSASVLWFATGIFFTKFAFIISLTILFSLLWSLVYFVAACLAFGPENERGNLKQLLSRTRA